MKQNNAVSVAGRWGVWLSLLVGIVFVLPLWMCLDSVPVAQAISVRVGSSWLLSIACVMVHIWTRRYFLEGVLAGMGGTLSLHLWMTTDRYTFVDNAGTLHFWRVSLIVALLTVMTLMLADYWLARRRHPSRTKTAVSMLTLACAGVVMFGQCEATLTHLNAAWDTSVPRRHWCEVAGNWVEHVSRGATQTILLLNKDGQTVRLVRSASYAEYEEGDGVFLLEYEGAFDKAYYLLEEKE